MIPILDLTAQYLSLQPQLDAAVRQVLAAGRFIMGPNVSAFEKEMAAYIGVPHAVSLNSGTDALVLALRALDIGPGDEVITSPFSFFATSEAILANGARPVFADVDPRTLNLDPAAAEAAITPRTKAILPVHLYGQPAAMAEILDVARRHGLAVVEDCAQAIGAEAAGARVGSFGDVGCFSFFPTKNLGACGDGGMIVTRSGSVADRIRGLRTHGGPNKYYHLEAGMNSRLDEMQAAILRVKFPHLDRWNQARAAVAARYRSGFARVEEVSLPPEVADTKHVYHQFTVRVAGRDRICERLNAAGVQTMVYYPTPLHLQPAHRELGYAPGAFPAAEAAAREVLSLPIFPELEAGDQDKVINEVLNLVEARIVA